MTARSIATMAVSVTLLSSLALPVFAQSTTGAAGPIAIPPRVPPVGLDLPCVQAAVDVRETAIGTAFSTFSAAQSAALSARKTALHDAWGTTDGKTRRTARAKAWEDYRVASKGAHTALRTAREDIWKTFRTASAVCKVPVVESVNADGVGALSL